MKKALSALLALTILVAGFPLGIFTQKIALAPAAEGAVMEGPLPARYGDAPEVSPVDAYGLPAGEDQPRAAEAPVFLGEETPKGAETTWGDFAYLENEDGTVTITKYLGKADQVEVPETIDGKTVTGLGILQEKWDPAISPFYDINYKIKEVTLPDTLKVIGTCAFSKCYYLGEIRIPEGVTTIGKWAFENCIELQEIVIPQGVTTISWGTFYECLRLREIQIPDTVTLIEKYAFSGCRSLGSITLPSGLTSIGDNTFQNCVGLTAIELPAGVTTIGSAAFMSCENLMEVSLPDGLTSIGNSAFSNCLRLEKISLPESVNKIGQRAFAFCTNLKAINIPSKVTVLHNGLFRGCASLTTITIPDTVAVLSPLKNDGETGGAFQQCASLTSIIIPDSVTYIDEITFDRSPNVTIYGTSGSYAERYAREHGIPFETGLPPAEPEPVQDQAKPEYWYRENGDGSVSIAEYTGSEARVTIPDSLGGKPVTAIGLNAFNDCQNLTAIVIPEGITTIGVQAFYLCSSLTEVAFPSSLTTVEYAAFSRCTGLKQIVLPESVTTMGDRVFSHCSSMVSAVLSKEITYIQTETFMECTALVEMPIFPKVNRIGRGAFYECSSMAEFSIPDGVSVIEGFAFQCCYRLTDITLPASLTVVEDSVLSHCYHLLGVVIPEGVTTIEKCAFYDDVSLISVQMPSTLTTIGRVAFSYCSELATVIIPDNVTTIESGVFSGCFALTSLYIPSSVTDLFDNTFEVTANLTIYGEEGSWVETYAKERNIPFVVGRPDPVGLPDWNIQPKPGEDTGLKKELITVDGKTMTILVSSQTARHYTQALTAEQLLQKLQNGEKMEIFSPDGTQRMTGSNNLGTGCVVRFAEDVFGQSTATLVILGDADGDGVSGSNDLLYLHRALMGIRPLPGPHLRALQVSGRTGDGVSVWDALLVRRYIMSRIDSYVS